jgi:predicted component of type VI protein secretion system
VHPAHHTTTPTQARTQDLINLLLDRAVLVSHALTRLHSLAAMAPPGLSRAHSDVEQAIATMTGVRANLIRNADHLTGLLEGPHKQP